MAIICKDKVALQRGDFAWQIQHWWMEQSNWWHLLGLLQSVWWCPTWHPHLQIGETWIWSMDHSVNEELAGWQHTKSCGQWLTVHIGYDAKWCPLGSLLVLILFSIFLLTWTVEVSALCWQDQAVWCSGHTGGKRCHSEEPGQAWEVGLCKPHEIQQREVQCPTPGLWQSRAHLQVGWRSDWECPTEKDCDGWFLGL